MFEQRSNAKGVTVDGEVSRDLDDAIWVEKGTNEWKIQVSITDVSSLIHKGSIEDRVAFQKAFTIYYATGNSPMLPRKFADRELSLLQGKKRKTITFFIVLDSDLEVRCLSIKRTHLTNLRKMSHKEVDSILEEQSHNYHQWWMNCFELAQALIMKRRKQGALVIYDLNKGLITNEDGQVVQVPHGKNYRAYLIVQELMILVNHRVTQYLHQKGVPILYRNHSVNIDKNRQEYLEGLAELLVEPTSVQLNQICSNCRHLMQRAKYEPTLKEHFALNLDGYSHWTSPIRRYADLVNHRVLVSWLKGEAPPYSIEELQTIAKHLNYKSDQKREADKVHYREQQVTKLSKLKSQGIIDLPIGEFHYYLICLIEETFPMSQERSSAVIQRISNNSVGNDDIARIIFMDETLHYRWTKIKKAALIWLYKHQNQTTSVIVVASQICDSRSLEDLVFDHGSNGSGHNLTHYSSVQMQLADRLVQSSKFPGSSIKEADQRALLDLLIKISNVPDPQPKINTKTKSKVQGNPKGLLFECCMAHQIKTPEFHITDITNSNPKAFSCYATLEFEGQVYQSEEFTYTNKKQVERLASDSLLQKLPLSFTLIVEQKHYPSCPINPISAVSEWTQKNQTNAAIYDFTEGKGKVKIFKCACTLVINQVTKKWEGGIGSNKKEAQSNAAKAACRDLYQ